MTAHTAGQGTGGRTAPTGGGVPGADHRWAPGEQVLWRYRANGSAEIHICRPVTVVQDTSELLAVWLAPGTLCVRPELVDGTAVHCEPLATRYTRPRRTARVHWTGNGVLKLARAGEPWSVWLFWEPGWRFRNYYVNLEEPRLRWPGGIDSEDHFLDIGVRPDGSWHWIDEDEFAQASAVGLLDTEQCGRVRAAGLAAVERIEAWAAPFDGGWDRWRPDPAWSVPALRDDWDRAPVTEHQRLS
ncbi:cytidylyl-2-hydroxypropylphosphonate hydrolase [Streptomyces sp. TP-A0874]|uniref:cytidylyl-2-hydroxypropylphosphonate hydrolase n=1 Tax=Streptomyces sp. TP-A0874 TaxID=549819 RepID=UPI000852C41E|nr:DUF402 domain-containing protein [Streptomyces sp. TP-A0874]